MNYRAAVGQTKVAICHTQSMLCWKILPVESSSHRIINILYHRDKCLQ